MRNFIIPGVLDIAEVNGSLAPGQGYKFFTGPGTKHLDLSLTRHIHFKVCATLPAPAEASNLFNHANDLNTIHSVHNATSQRNDASCSPFNLRDASPNRGFEDVCLSTRCDGPRGPS